VCLDLTESPSPISLQPFRGNGISTTGNSHIVALAQLLQENADAKTTLEAQRTELQNTIESLRVQLTKEKHENIEIRAALKTHILSISLGFCNTCGIKFGSDDVGAETWLLESCGAVSELMASYLQC
jgi:hypothetical protein